MKKVEKINKWETLGNLDSPSMIKFRDESLGVIFEEAKRLSNSFMDVVVVCYDPVAGLQRRTYEAPLKGLINVEEDLMTFSSERIFPGEEKHDFYLKRLIG